MVFKLKEKIKVGAFFDKRRKALFPRWFIREGIRYNIEKICYVWEERDGKNLFIHFSVISGGINYELVYDSSSVLWFLYSIEEEA